MGCCTRQDTIACMLLQHPWEDNFDIIDDFSGEFGQQLVLHACAEIQHSFVRCDVGPILLVDGTSSVVWFCCFRDCGLDVVFGLIMLQVA